MIKQITLENGVRVVTEHIPHVHSVSIGIWVAVGSRYEPREVNGISHFVEHMVFKGTKTRTARAIAEAFDRVGGHVNAFTSKEYTCFYAKVLDEHTPLALEILHDMFFNSVFAVEELEKEKQVIIEEIRMVEDTPDDFVHDLAVEASLAPHALGRPILGSVENIQQFTSKKLKSFVNRYYTPERTVITVAGRYPPSLMSDISRLFGTFTQNESTVFPRETPKFQPRIKHRVKQTEQAHLCLALPGMAINDRNIYSMALFNNIIGGSMSSRLFQEIREERGLAYSVYSYHTAFRDCGLFIIYVGTSADQTEQVVSLLLNILRQVRTHGIKKEELNRAKEQLKGSFILSLESTANRMTRLGKNELLIGKHFSQDEVLDKINRIEWEDVHAVSEQLLSNELSLAIISPYDKLPTTFRRDALV